MTTRSKCYLCAFVVHKPWDDEAKKNRLATVPKCKLSRTKNLSQYVGTYFNRAFGNIYITKIDQHLALSIGPKNIQWQLIPCRSDFFKAFWNSGINMLPEEQAMVRFFVKSHSTAIKMQIDYLNTDGTGVFKKLE